MKKEELYRDISKMVCEVTGISYTDMIYCNREECSDARYLLVRALAKIQFTDTEIGEMTGRTRPGISFIRKRDKKMFKWTVESNWKAIRKLIESKYFICK